MTESINIYDKYNINLSKLSRDYIKFPLKRSGSSKSSKLLEIPAKEDLEYLYLELNLSIKLICKIFQWNNVTLLKNIRNYKIVKPKEDKIKSRIFSKFLNNPNWKKDMVKKCFASREKNNPNWKEDMVKKIKQTNIKKYGVVCTLQSEEGIKKKNETWLKNLGVTGSPFNSNKVRIKSKHTLINRYGVEYASQNDEIRGKQKQTNLDRYGKIGYNNREKYKQTCLKRYGVDNPFKSKEIMKNIIGRTSSKHEKLWLKQLNVNLMQKDFHCGDNTYFVDGYDQTTNTVYEFLGDFYHGNPKIFNFKDINPRLNITYEDLYNYTFKRFNNLKNTYNVKIIYIWDSDFMKNNKIKEDWREKMIEY